MLCFHLRRIGPPATSSECANVICLLNSVTFIGRNLPQADERHFKICSANFEQNVIISRRHARIIRQDDSNIYHIYDDSMNGIFVNDVKIDGSAALSEGDSVTFGHMQGYNLQPGTKARQPDSEYQYVFEQCSCAKGDQLNVKLVHSFDYPLPSAENYKTEDQKNMTNGCLPEAIPDPLALYEAIPDPLAIIPSGASVSCIEICPDEEKMSDLTHSEHHSNAIKREPRSSDGDVEFPLPANSVRLTVSATSFCVPSAAHINGQFGPSTSRFENDAIAVKSEPCSDVLPMEMSSKACDIAVKVEKISATDVTFSQTSTPSTSASNQKQPKSAAQSRSKTCSLIKLRHLSSFADSGAAQKTASVSGRDDVVTPKPVSMENAGLDDETNCSVKSLHDEQKDNLDSDRKHSRGIVTDEINNGTLTKTDNSRKRSRVKNLVDKSSAKDHRAVKHSHAQNEIKGDRASCSSDTVHEQSRKDDISHVVRRKRAHDDISEVTERTGGDNKKKLKGHMVARPHSDESKKSEVTSKCGKSTSTTNGHPHTLHTVSDGARTNTNRSSIVSADEKCAANSGNEQRSTERQLLKCHESSSAISSNTHSKTNRKASASGNGRKHTERPVASESSSNIHSKNCTSMPKNDTGVKSIEKHSQGVVQTESRTSQAAPGKGRGEIVLQNHASNSDAKGSQQKTIAADSLVKNSCAKNSTDPTKLAPHLIKAGWKRFFSKSKRRVYFFNLLTGESLWDMPVAQPTGSVK